MIDHRQDGSRQDVGMVKRKPRFGGVFCVRGKSRRCLGTASIGNHILAGTLGAIQGLVGPAHQFGHGLVGVTLHHSKTDRQ